MTQSTGITRWFNLLSRDKKKSRRRSRSTSGRWGSRLSFETLETREMLATTPILFNIPTDVANRGVEVAAFAQLTAPYTPSGQTQLPANTYVYFDPSVGPSGDYTAATTANDFSFDLTITGGQASFQLPDALVKGGQIVISVGGAPVITYTSGPSGGFASPTAGTSPTSYFGLFEYTIDGSGINIDASSVDQIGFPFTITTNPAAPNPANDGVGISQNRGNVFNLYGEYIASLGASAAEFKQSLTYGNGYRILAPSHLIDGTLGSERPVLHGLVQSDYSKGGKLVIQTPYYYWVTALGSAGGESAAGNSTQAVPFNKSVKGRNVPQRTVHVSWDQILAPPVTRSTAARPTNNRPPTWSAPCRAARRRPSRTPAMSARPPHRRPTATPSIRSTRTSTPTWTPSSPTTPHPIRSATPGTSTASPPHSRATRSRTIRSTALARSTPCSV